MIITKNKWCIYFWLLIKKRVSDPTVRFDLNDVTVRTATSLVVSLNFIYLMQLQYLLIFAIE